MRRSIKNLHNFDPPTLEEEIRASALQFVRKLSGFTHPSKANEAASARELLDSLVTTTPPRDRSEEAAKAPARAAVRFGA
jgi:hypothetical protein